MNITASANYFLAAKCLVSDYTQTDGIKDQKVAHHIVNYNEEKKRFNETQHQRIHARLANECARIQPATKATLLHKLLPTVATTQELPRHEC